MNPLNISKKPNSPACKNSPRAVAAVEIAKFPAIEIVDTNRGQKRLTLLFDSRGFQLFQTEEGEFVVDVCFSFGVQDPISGGYQEYRERKIVNKETALGCLLSHVVSSCFDDLIDPFLTKLLCVEPPVPSGRKRKK